MIKTIWEPNIPKPRQLEELRLIQEYEGSVYALIVGFRAAAYRLTFSRVFGLKVTNGNSVLTLPVNHLIESFERVISLSPEESPWFREILDQRDEYLKLTKAGPDPTSHYMISFELEAPCYEFIAASFEVQPLEAPEPGTPQTVT